MPSANDLREAVFPVTWISSHDLIEQPEYFNVTELEGEAMPQTVTGIRQVDATMVPRAMSTDRLLGSFTHTRFRTRPGDHPNEVMVMADLAPGTTHSAVLAGADYWVTFPENGIIPTEAIRFPVDAAHEEIERLENRRRFLDRQRSPEARITLPTIGPSEVHMSEMDNEDWANLAAPFVAQGMAYREAFERAAMLLREAQRFVERRGFRAIEHAANEVTTESGDLPF